MPPPWGARSLSGSVLGTHRLPSQSGLPRVPLKHSKGVKEGRARLPGTDSSTRVQPCQGAGSPTKDLSPLAQGPPDLCLGGLGGRSSPTFGPATPRRPGEPWKMQRGHNGTWHPRTRGGTLREPWAGVLPAPWQPRLQGLVLGGTMGLRTTHLAWGANLPRDAGEAGGAEGAWHTSVSLLALGTTAALPREQCHPQDLGALVYPRWGHVPSTPHHHAPLQGGTHLSTRGSCVTFVSLTRRERS